jgi:hypothetical protein
MMILRMLPVRCWICLGRGYIDTLGGPYACPNPHCEYRKKTWAGR